jgi:hypothetical protein
MIPFIVDSRRKYRVESIQEQAAHHAKRLSREGLVPHTVETPVAAYVNDNRWLIDCECGSGNYTDPTLKTAYCYGCGAVHANVTFPAAADRVAIEEALIERPVPRTRNWYPSETVDTLIAENIEHGLRAVGEQP